MPFGHQSRLEIEPGRYLVAESGYLVTEIRAIKQMGENTFYLVDAGFNNLARPILYGAYHPMSIVPARRSHASGRCDDVVVGGPLCESGDIFTQDEGGFVSHAQLARPPQVGDLLVIESRRRLRLRDGLELQLEAAGGRSADRRRPAAFDPRPADVRRSDPRRNDSSRTLTAFDLDAYRMLESRP